MPQGRPLCPQPATLRRSSRAPAPNPASPRPRRTCAMSRRSPNSARPRAATSRPGNRGSCRLTGQAPSATPVSAHSSRERISSMRMRSSRNASYACRADQIPSVCAVAAAAGYNASPASASTTARRSARSCATLPAPVRSGLMYSCPMFSHSQHGYVFPRGKAIISRHMTRRCPSTAGRFALRRPRGRENCNGMSAPPLTFGDKTASNASPPPLIRLQSKACPDSRGRFAPPVCRAWTEAP